MSPRSDAAESALSVLRRAHREERLESRTRAARERDEVPFETRVARGVALDRPELDELESAAGGRLRLWLRPRRPTELDDLKMRSGDPVLLSFAEDPKQVTRALVSRRDRDRLSIVVESDVDERILEGGFRVERDAPEVTFDRGDAALAAASACAADAPLAQLSEVAYGEALPRRGRAPDAARFDRDLTPTQERAIEEALTNVPVGLIHGPPGTGKTRTLVELVRRCVAAGERVLVSAPSHAALDTLGERLLAAGVPLLRLGHPARASATMEAATLDDRLARSDAAKRVRKLEREARELRRRASRLDARTRELREERRQLRVEAKRIDRDVRAMLAVEEERELARARVVLATLAGAADRMLDAVPFDRVVVDEATQAPDPLALIPLARAPRAVLAGDPEQLAPTVISAGAAELGLGRTLFVRLRDRFGASLCTTLDVQHRMHERLMRPSNAAFYAGVVRTADAVRARTLDPATVAPDAARPAPLCVLDTAGRGYEEEPGSEDASTSNRAQAERVAREVARLVSRGVPEAFLSVLTPYDAQARLLRGLLAAERARGLEVSTIDGFQGRENEVVVVDLVRSNAESRIGFLADLRRMNVAITRARSLLLLVGDGATLGSHPFYAKLWDDAASDDAVVSAWEDDGEPF